MENKMAVMWPRKLPRHIKTNSLRRAECRVYERLAEVLEDPFVVFYSRPWLGEKPNGEEIDGECDFVVAHPDMGYLALEVKGGGIRYIPELDKWTSKDHNGLVHNIKNPVSQARSSKYEILKKLKNSPLWNPKHIHIGHGIIFPDCEENKCDLAADIPRDLVCYLQDIEGDFQAWILNRFGKSDSHDATGSPLGEDGIRALEDLLARPFNLHVRVGRIFEEDEKEISVLTQQQYHILSAIEEIQRAAISGGAGTGKTILALEEARRCAAAGMRVLFTCFNKPLATHVRQRLSVLEGIRVATFHELCYQSAKEAEIRIPDTRSSEQLYGEVYPEVLMKALKILPNLRFDVIIIDEGQDFRPLWWTALESALDPSGKKLMRVFYDCNQRVYGTADKLHRDFQLVPIRLKFNMRNTQTIHKISQNYYSGYPIESTGPDGIDIVWIRAQSFREIQQQINSLIPQLVSGEHIPAGHITILVSNEKLISQLAPAGKIGTADIQRCTDPEANAITIDTVRRFKGLESPVVILIVDPEIMANDELLYVALSRARSQLIIIGDPKSLERIQTMKS
jgi:hypothetical protein